MKNTSHQLVIGNSENMDAIGDETVDLVITSPPYPMIEMWDEIFGELNCAVSEAIVVGDGKLAFKLMNEELNKIWKEVDRKIKPGGFVCINIGDATRSIGGKFRLYSNHTEITKYFDSLGYDVLPMILWRKQTNKPNKFMGSGMLPAGAYVTLEHEYILIFRKSDARRFNTLGKSVRRQSAFFWEERNVWFSDIWFDLKGTSQIMKNNSSRERSAAYPFELPYRIINMYSLQGDLVLDPFLGTGTTALAAMVLGRNSNGCEIDPDFKSVINKKLSEAKTVSNTVINQRLKSHIEFVKKRESENKIMKHTSNLYKFPLISKQEVEIKFPIIKEIRKIGTFAFDVVYDIIEANLESNDTIRDLESTISELNVQSTLDDWI